MTPDEVFQMAWEAGAADLCPYHFDTAYHTDCNGIWAVAETAEDESDAAARIASLMKGTLPPGISAANAATEEWLRERWEEHVRAGWAAQDDDE